MSARFRIGLAGLTLSAVTVFGMASAQELPTPASAAQIVPAAPQPPLPGDLVAAAPALAHDGYLWAPERSADGRLAIVISLSQQRLAFYRGGIPVAVSAVSTGRPGHRTPPGRYRVLHRAVRHFSSTYNNAPMPYMQRLTARGIALHGGILPGYPASHGCIRLPHEFARLLYGATALGTAVTIVQGPLPATAP